MLRLLAAALFASFIAVSPVSAADAFTDAQRAALDGIIKQYLLDNPRVLIDSVETYYNAQNQNKKAQEGPLSDYPAGLLDNPNDPAVGPKDAPIAVVEFFDYNCGYCKQVAADMERLMDEEKNIRVVFKELPILSDTSELAARYALAANKQGKYRAYHLALLQHQGPINEDFLVATAKSQDLDIEKLKKDANSQDVRDVLNKNVELARELGVRGTPFFVIGKEKIPGAIGYGRIKEILNNQRGASPSAAAAPSAVPSAAPAAAPSVPAAAAEPRDPEADAEIEKARAEARAMIEEVKAEAAKLQAEAAKAQEAAPAKKAE